MALIINSVNFESISDINIYDQIAYNRIYRHGQAFCLQPGPLNRYICTRASGHNPALHVAACVGHEYNTALILGIWSEIEEDHSEVYRKLYLYMRRSISSPDDIVDYLRYRQNRAMDVNDWIPMSAPPRSYWGN